MEIQEYADWSLGVHQRLGGQRVPFSGTFELTRRCNNQCAHCYNNLPINDADARSRELSLEECCQILDEIAAAGCLWLLLTGGEIFLRQDFLDIYTYAGQKGMLISLFTNGTLITPEVADYLVRQPPFSIEITLYGHTRETYERVSGVSGSFERCLRGIRLLMERELPLKLKTMAITLNKHEIWDMRRFVEAELGLEFKFDPIINPRCDGSQGPLDLRLTSAEVVELDLKDSDRITEWNEFCDKFGDRDLSAEQSDNLWKCGGGQNSFAIDPCGMLRMCILSFNDAYDLRRGSFLEGWEQFLYQIRQRKITSHTKCISCKIIDMCGMCPANAELECQDPETPVDFLCQVAHLRAYCLGIAVEPHGECEYCAGGSRYDEILSTAKKIKHLMTQPDDMSVPGTTPAPGKPPLYQNTCAADSDPAGSVDDNILPELITQLLREGHQVRFRAPGESMRPAVLDGDVLIVEPIDADAVKVGDIILYLVEKRLIAHRVINIEKVQYRDGLTASCGAKFSLVPPNSDTGAIDNCITGNLYAFILRGDASYSYDEPVYSDQILGKAITIERNGRLIQPYSLFYRLTCRARVWASRLKRVYF
jgi:radical SAM protein with 4Fe4S-binding SPASM domain